MLKRLIAAVLKASLMILDKVFLLARKKSYPCTPMIREPRRLPCRKRWKDSFGALSQMAIK
jgi:hypothetical protein